jgi:RHS repeat-associated protein
VFAAWQTDLYYCAGATDPAASCTSNNGNFHKQVLQALNGVTYTAGYTYDPINRLKTAIETRPGTPNPVENWRQTFVYDPYGNRAQLAEAGRLATMEGSTPSVPSETPPVWPFNAKNQWTGAAFDLSGNQETTWGPNGTDARASKFVFDGENRIATATVTKGVGAVSYGYDGDGRRVTSTVGGVTTTFVYDAFGAMVAEYGSALGNSGCLSCLVTVDHLGSTRVVWDAAGGAPVRLYDYSPFGEEVNATLRAGDARYPAPIYPVSTRNDVGPMFTGQTRDSETGLDYFRARHMSSPAGRFVSPDAPFVDQRAGDPQSWNLYGYVRNNPLAYVDPTGQDLRLAGNREELYKMLDSIAGGFTDNYSIDSNGNVHTTLTANDVKGDEGMQFVFDLVTGKEQYVLFAGGNADAAKAAALFQTFAFQNSAMLEKEFLGGQLVGTAGRGGGAPQPVGAFSTIAINVDAQRRQIGTANSEFNPSHSAISAQASTNGQLVQPAAFLFHEAAENLAFAAHVRSGGSMKGPSMSSSYISAHGAAIEREIRWRAQRPLRGGFGGGFIGK